jgi:hypothetical protein
LACYNTLTYFSALSIKKEKIKHLLNQNNIKTHFYFGKKDALFPPKIGQKFCEDLNNTNLHIIDDGHDLVNHQLNDFIKSKFSQTSNI